MMKSLRGRAAPLVLCSRAFPDCCAWGRACAALKVPRSHRACLGPTATRTRPRLPSSLMALVDWPELEHALLPGEAAVGWEGHASGAAELDEAPDPLLFALCAEDEGVYGGAAGTFDAADPHGAGGLGGYAGLRKWRCLDARHGAGPCPRCTPPPDNADAERFALRGDAKSGREGEKRLRQMLARTPEWADAVAREAAALLAEAEGIPDLADALRKRSLAALRKRSFLALCRSWGYRSDVWAPLAPARRRAAALALGPVAQPQPREAAGDAVRRDLDSTLTAFLRFAGMPLLCAASVCDPFSPIATVNMQARDAAWPGTKLRNSAQHFPHARRQ